MKTQELIAEARSIGASFELDGDGFRVRAPRGVITSTLREELSAHKSEIVTLLSQTEAEVTVTYIAGRCLHCGQLLRVFTHPLDDEVWLQCPTQPDIFKQLKRAENGWCSDCGVKLSVIAGRCKECIQCVMLAPSTPCPVCGGLRFWRHRAIKCKPAGFAWYCAACLEPAGKVAIFELSE